MPLDGNGNFYPSFPGMPPFSPADSVVQSGAGAPSNGTGSNGDVYVNTTNGDIYTKSGDTWTIVSGGSGAVEVLIGSQDDPNGSHIPTDPDIGALYYKDGVLAPVQFWRWSPAETSWKEIITT